MGLLCYDDTSCATCSLACVCPPACTFINIKGLLVKILTKITAIVSQPWLDVDFYICYRCDIALRNISSSYVKHKEDRRREDLKSLKTNT